MKALSKSIVFIAGTFIGNNCWEEWQSYFESKGYKTLAPPWPHKSSSPEELRNRHPDEAIAQNRLADLTEYYATIINTLPGKPVLIGHSLGGLIVQLLLQRGLGTAGVAVHSFPAQTISTFTVSLIKEWWETMGFFTSLRESYLMPFEKWNNTVVNGLPSEQKKQLYYTYAIPESKLTIRDAFKWQSKIDFKSPHPPLLFTSGSLDRIIPASLNYHNFKKYSAETSITHYMDFKASNHLVFGGSAWKEEADFILYWLSKL